MLWSVVWSARAVAEAMAAERVRCYLPMTSISMRGMLPPRPLVAASVGAATVVLYVALAPHRALAANAAGAPAADPVKWTDVAQLAITAVGIPLTLLGLFFVVRQLQQTRAEGRSERTAVLFERFQAREYLSVASSTFAFLRTRDPADCMRRILAWDDVPSGESRLPGWKGRYDGPLLNDVRHVIQFFEELAGLFNAESIDAKLVRRLFPQPVVGHFGLSWWLIHHIRRGRVAATGSKPKGAGETLAYAEWEKMVRTLLREREDLRPAPASAEVWVLCFPPATATIAERERYVELTRRASRPLHALDDLERALGQASTPLGRSDRPPVRVLCIPPWGDPDSHERVQRLGTRLAALLTAHGLDAVEPMILSSS